MRQYAPPVSAPAKTTIRCPHQSKSVWIWADVLWMDICELMLGRSEQLMVFPEMLSSLEVSSNTKIRYQLHQKNSF
jgi:hypothetical protein